MTDLNFRSILANQLIGEYSKRKRKGPGVIVGGKKLRKDAGRTVNLDNSIRKINVGSHFPIQGTYRRYAKCSMKKLLFDQK